MTGCEVGYSPFASGLHRGGLIGKQKLSRRKFERCLEEGGKERSNKTWDTIGNEVRYDYLLGFRNASSKSRPIREREVLPQAALRMG